MTKDKKQKLLALGASARQKREALTRENIRILECAGMIGPADADKRIITFKFDENAPAVLFYPSTGSWVESYSPRLRRSRRRIIKHTGGARAFIQWARQSYFIDLPTQQ